MKTLESTILAFSNISLDEMNDVKLMSRFDTKFVFSIDRLVNIFSKLIPYYRVLEIDGNRIHDYKSIYYDTDARKFYLDHHNQRVNRNKVRFREYAGSGLTFLEIKLKNNKGRTVKKRMQVDKILECLDVEHKDYIYKTIGDNLEINAKQWIFFKRITFVHNKQKERVTVDIDLSFKDQNQEGEMKDIVIAEVKQEKMSRSSDFIRILKEMSILPLRLSKYCISTMQLSPDIKQNRFKKKLLYINKLKHT